MQIVVFSVDNEKFAVEVAQVLEVINTPDITPVPNSPNYILGFINLRGKVISVVDMKKKFSLEEKDPNKESKVIVVESKDFPFGVKVDSVEEVLEVDENSIQKAPDIISGKMGEEYINGVIIVKEDEEMEKAKEHEVTSITDEVKENVYLYLSLKDLLTKEDQKQVKN